MTPPAPRLTSFIQERLAEDPAPHRVELLRPLAEAVAATDEIDLVFLCTHNSRRSHLSQIWAQTGAHHFGLAGVRTFSGGTEATAFNPRAIAAIERAGFGIEWSDSEANPVVTVRGGDDLVMECVSKVYGHASNPHQGFTAVMTCSDADEACPVVPGATLRFAIPYVDPKVSDGTPHEMLTYDDRCAEIATEMLWVMKTAAAMR